MEIFANRLRERAEQLGISNAEAARRCGLNERRYAHYTQGVREPDLRTLVNIARVLGTSPDYLLGASDPEPQDETSLLLDRLMSAARVLRKPQLMTVVTQTEALAAETAKEKP